MSTCQDYSPFDTYFFIQHSVSFLEESDKIKVQMHLHSFTYDFHLRVTQSYIRGRQLIFTQGYHVTKFLDDFIKYYPKGPNFARNTVHSGKFRYLLYEAIVRNCKIVHVY